MEYPLSPGCQVCELLPRLDPAMTLLEDDFWVANLRDNDQTLLGTTFVTLKRHASELDGLTAAEDTSFITIRNTIIGAIRTSFNPLTFNVSCLKNNAFQSDPDQTPPEAAHVHWHIKPRFGTRPVSFAGETFVDPLPGRYLGTFERKRVDPKVSVAIAALLRANLSYSL